MSDTNIAGAWRERAAAARAAAPVSPTAPVDLGDGCKFIGRRIDVPLWVKGGRVPQHLTEQLIRIHKGEQADIDEVKMTAAEVIGANRFQRDLVKHSVALPIIVDDEKQDLGPDEIRWSEIFADCPDWIDKIANWQLEGAPGIPVQLISGEVVELGELETFRPDSGESTTAGTRGDVSKLRTATK
jgi:hypothetical protein